MCKFLVNSVMANHLRTITSPLIALGGTRQGGYPDFPSIPFPMFDILGFSQEAWVLSGPRHDLAGGQLLAGPAFAPSDQLYLILRAFGSQPVSQA